MGGGRIGPAQRTLVHVDGHLQGRLYAQTWLIDLSADFRVNLKSTTKKPFLISVGWFACLKIVPTQGTVIAAIARFHCTV